MDRYQDPIPDRLMDEALASNADLAGCRPGSQKPGPTPAWPPLPGCRRSGLKPRDRNKSSQLGSFPLPSGQPLTQTTHRATLEASYEVDLWGRYRRADEAAWADLLASEAAQSAVRLSLTADVARQYFAPPRGDRPGGGRVRRTNCHPRRNAGAQRRRMDAGLQSEYDPARAKQKKLRLSPMASPGGRTGALRPPWPCFRAIPAEVTAGILERGAPACRKWSSPLRPAPRTCCPLPRPARGRRGPGRGECPIGVARADTSRAFPLTAARGQARASLTRLFSRPGRHLLLCRRAHPADLERRPGRV